MQKAAHSVLPNIARKNKLTGSLLDIMEQRIRAQNTPNYDDINRQVKLTCKIANENGLEVQCKEIENLEKQHLTKKMQEKIPRVANRRKTTQHDNSTI